jgi:3-methyladenine DNA glycosylase AlkD
MSLTNLRNDLKQYWREDKADFFQKHFFAKDGNASKDIFRGISVPNSRLIAKKYKDLSLEDIKKLLESKVHEEKLIAVIILTLQYEKGDEDHQQRIIDFYLNHTFYIDDWDLVDTGAYKILGNYLLDRPRDILIKLAKSNNWWERRIAMIATLEFIKQKDHESTFKLAEILLNDKHDLIHKAVGWMLREVGDKISLEQEEEFLKKYYQKMPRTMLRYAIEKFPPDLKEKYMTKKIKADALFPQ